MIRLPEPHTHTRVGTPRDAGDYLRVHAPNWGTTVGRHSDIRKTVEVEPFFCLAPRQTHATSRDHKRDAYISHVIEGIAYS